MIEALWSLEFLTNTETLGAGVVVLESGKVYGGDSSFIYTGTYYVEQSVVHLEVFSSRFSDALQLPSIFQGIERFHLEVSGPLNADGNGMTLCGFVVEFPNLEILVKAIRREDLP